MTFPFASIISSLYQIRIFSNSSIRHQRAILFYPSRIVVRHFQTPLYFCLEDSNFKLRALHSTTAWEHFTPQKLGKLKKDVVSSNRLRFFQQKKKKVKSRIPHRYRQHLTPKNCRKLFFGSQQKKPHIHTGRIRKIFNDSFSYPFLHALDKQGVGGCTCTW